MTNLLALSTQIDAAYEREEAAARLLADLMIDPEYQIDCHYVSRYRAEVNEAVEFYRKAKEHRQALADQFASTAEGNSKK